MRLVTLFIEKGLAVWRVCEHHFIPAYAWQGDPLTFWRERIVFLICFTAGTLGMIALIPSVVLAIRESLWIVALLDAMAYLTTVAILFGGRLPFILRAWGVCIILYALGTGLMLSLGPLGAGYIWLFGASVMAAALLGVKAAVGSLLINLCILVGTGFFIAGGAPLWSQPFDHMVEKWSVMSINFMLINVLITVTTALMLGDLKQTLMQTRQDIAKRKTVEASLRVSERRFRTLVAHAPLGIITIDSDGAISDANPKFIEMFGFPSLKAALALNLFRSHRLALTKFPEQLDDGLVGGIAGTYEGAYETSWGKSVYLRYMLTPLMDTTGSIYAVLGIFDDITQSRIQEKQLRRAQKMEALGLLAGGVAHDLNNVLSGIVSYPELLLLDLPADSPLRDPILTIQQAGQRAAEIVQDLLTLARRGVVTVAVLDLNQLIGEYLDSPEFEKLLSFHPAVRIESRLQASLLNLSGSGIHLKKTIMNLVSNAAEAQPRGGRILITTENRYVDRLIEGYDNVAEGDYVVLRVEDKGIGIPPEDLKRIFEPFYTKKVMGRSGTGLGMAVVWATVQDHKGYIDVHSVKGEGTTFELYFPATRQEPDSSRAALPMDGYLGRGQTILIVDDVKEQRMIASGILKRLNYCPVCVGDGAAAVAYLSTRMVDLVLLDMVMDPGPDGLDTYRRICEIHPGQPAIIASGFSETDRVREAIELGVAQYVKKPYTVETIGLAVKAALR
ncbi:hypothetical protein DSCO28_10410 [Desulfosarcina ovata subsp. sediminis]|uniref:histidine kinase n=1 Tax=Desulfosarcina ovata subsp. sediminis TaxID=885957 RepID=A0A5K7ZJR5_9BACT|nr:ATP-binding protein [Desulfosarcina ovata]BBO80475.1 hypothetical protein DSCO28_10410 [Desulfosarcina ovata subsp. sediminis]